MDIRTEIDGLDVFYRIYDCESDDNFFDIVEDLEEEIRNQFIQRCETFKLMAVGHTLYIGYDGEWVNKGNCCQILSYQFYVIGVGGEIAVVFLTDKQLGLKEMLNVILKIALQTGTALHYPRDIVLAGYFLRIDLAKLSDFNEFKRELSNIGGSVATTYRPLDINFSQGDRSFLSQIVFYDLMKHAPEKTPLSVLGDLLGIEKLTVPDIDRMDKLREQDFDLFIDYGIRDAEIVVKYYQHILEFSKRILDRNFDRGLISATAGSLAVSLCKQTIEAGELDFEDTFGLTTSKTVDYDGERSQFISKKRIEHSDDRSFYEDFVSKCYHGGLNVCYYVGPTEEDIFFDYDLSGAYTTGLTVIRPFDYENAYETRNIKEFLGDVMGFARVDFKFPAKTKYPCLPVTDPSRDGLNFPLEGISHCTAPELAMAHKLGATITIKRGVIYPWKSEERIFKPFVQKIRELRKQSEKGSFSNQYAKLLGNSLYGKTGQGVKGKSAFDTRDMRSIKVPESRVTNAAMAAYVTGFIRAVMSEIVCKIPNERTIVNCVTDGILTNAREDEIDLSGELCQRFQSLVGEGGKMIEIKHEVKQALSIKTRGVATLIHGDNPFVDPVVLAKVGVSAPAECEDVNQYIVDLYFNRVPQQKVIQRPFTSIREQWTKDVDVIRLSRETTLNYEYDFKRRPVNPRMIGSHVAFDTMPWKTIDEIAKVHSMFSYWKEKRCIKTLEDFGLWDDYCSSRLALDSVSYRFPNGKIPIQVTIEEGSAGVLKRLFLRAYNNSCWGMSRTLTYCKLIALMSRIGFNMSKHDGKNSNKGTVYDNLVPCTVLTKPLVKKLQKAFPELDTTKIFIP